MTHKAQVPGVVPFLIVFLASACVMTLELVASRLIAPYVGTNLFTWTSIIAVVLAGISVGNLLGGMIASRSRPERAGAVLAGALVSSAVLALMSVALVAPVFASSAGSGWGLPVRILVGVTLAFFAPAVVLGTISPLAATWAIASRSDLGTTVGGLFAVSSIGAIAGTLLTGFVLINTIGSVAIVVSVATVLGLAALLASRSRVAVAAVVFVIVTGSVVAWGAAGYAPSPVAAAAGEVVYARETSYQTVAVAWDSARGVRTVVLDNLVHGFVVPNDLRLLMYPYIALYASAFDALRASRSGVALTSLHLGGGAFTMPRYIADAFPADRVIVAEIDPGVTLASYEAARLDRPPPFELHHADARHVVGAIRRSGGQVDAVFADAFTDYAIPFHLATVEFYREVDAILTDGGWLMQNVIDDLGDPRMLAAIVATVGEVHDFVQVVSPAPLGELRGRDTFVVISSRERFDVSDVLAVARAATVFAEEVSIATILGAVPPRYTRPLRDDFAPVERLIAHLYRASVP